MFNRGGPKWPLEAADLIVKFDDSVKRGLPSASADLLRNAVSASPNSDLSHVAALLRSVSVKWETSSY